MNNAVLISEYNSTDGYGSKKKAIVSKDNKGYEIDFYENEEYVHSVYYTDKSLHYVEDAAENYVQGFTNIKDF